MPQWYKRSEALIVSPALYIKFPHAITCLKLRIKNLYPFTCNVIVFSVYEESSDDEVNSQTSSHSYSHELLWPGITRIQSAIDMEINVDHSFTSVDYY